MSTVSTTNSVIATAPPHRVYTRAEFTAEWTERPYLWCDSLVFRAAPGFNEATLSWNYGDILQPGALAYAKFEPVDFNRHYIKIVAGLPDAEPLARIEWYGILLVDDRDLRGAMSGIATPTDTIPSGRQALTAQGMEYFLVRQLVNSAVVYNYDDDGPMRLNRPLVFNGGRDARGASKQPGNRCPSSVGATDDGWMFDLHNEDRWNARQALEYLCKYHIPQQRGGPGGATLAPMPFDIVPLGQLDALEGYEPEVDCDRPFWDILVELIDRRRGVGFYCLYVPFDPDAAEEAPTRDQLQIHVFTFTAEDLVVGDYTLPANTAPVSLDFERAFDVKVAALRVDGNRRRTQYVARGNRRGVVGTFAKQDSSLDRAWEDYSQTLYNQGASLAVDYPGADNYLERKRRNGLARQADHLRRVYSWFRIDTFWGIREEGAVLGDGLGGETQYPVNPPEGTDGHLDEEDAALVYDPGLQLQDLLPLVQEVDYSGTKIAEGTVVDAEGNPFLLSTTKPFLPSFVALRIPAQGTGSTAGTERWALAENVATVQARGADGELIRTGFHVRLLDSEPGFELTASGGEQHELAGSDFIPLPGAGEIAPYFDWTEDLLATLYFFLNTHAEERYPADADLPHNIWIDRETIDVPDAWVDYVVPQTVVAITDGKLVRSTSGGFVRDDRARLQRIARFAYEIGSVDRKAFDLSYRQIKRVVSVGQMITEIGSAGSTTATRSVVTEVRYDLAGVLTSLNTEFLELDPLASK